MKQNIGLVAVLIVAAAGALWFRQRPLSLRQRLIAAGIAIVLLAWGFLAGPDSEVTAGRIGVVIAGVVILALAAWYVRGSDDEPGDGKEL
jgi:hypothetical protein